MVALRLLSLLLTREGGSETQPPWLWHSVFQWCSGAWTCFLGFSVVSHYFILHCYLNTKQWHSAQGMLQCGEERAYLSHAFHTTKAQPLQDAPGASGAFSFLSVSVTCGDCPEVMTWLLCCWATCSVSRQTATN